MYSMYAENMTSAMMFQLALVKLYSVNVFSPCTDFHVLDRQLVFCLPLSPVIGVVVSTVTYSKRFLGLNLLADWDLSVFFSFVFQKKIFLFVNN